MRSLFVDCPTGLAGDMILAAFLDLEVPIELIKSNLLKLGFENEFSIKVEESISSGLRGKKLLVESNESDNPNRSWKVIKKLLNESTLEEKLRSKVESVFYALAKSESLVHGKNIDDIHFHEVGAIDSLVDIVGVCSSVEYLNPNKIFCANPPMGSGIVSTSHGFLPVPAPAVLDLAKRYKIELLGGKEYPEIELTTPTGLALMAVLADNFSQPVKLDINKIGIGIGQRTIDRPNILRIIEFELLEDQAIINLNLKPTWQQLILQEAWVDDASSEDVRFLIKTLRQSGAIEVVSHSVLMKKDRQGVNIKALVKQDKAKKLRSIWFSAGTSIGLRETLIGRWILPRRKGFITTSLGKVKAKQVVRPDGEMTIKLEHDELIRLSHETKKNLDQIRNIAFSSSEAFEAIEDWTF